MKAVSLLLGILVGFPAGVVITAEAADKFVTFFGPFDLGRALSQLFLGGFFGAIVDGTIAVVVASNMQDRG
ncbi:hypothetical protein ACFSOZ_38625 [Mesorhizobium newzealandense]|uniref:Uncharacterized protein n=1 Tax=Mesorhizobium newzealandense TaxID=1300302 RepID=A0ABW4UQM3_9HYPH